MYQELTTLCFVLEYYSGAPSTKHIPVFMSSSGDTFARAIANALGVPFADEAVPAAPTAQRPSALAVLAPPARDSLSTASAVYHFAFTWNLWDPPSAAAYRPPPPTELEFCERFTHVRTVLAALGAHYIFQLERGASGRLHYQGYIHLPKGERQRPAGLAQQLSTQGLYGIHVSASSTAGQAALRTYCLKDETRVSGPWTDRDAKPLTPDESKRLQLIDFAHFYPWQRYIYDCITSEPACDRKINWIVDARGCSGKSSLGKYLAAHSKALLLPYVDAKDCLYLVSQQHKPAAAYIFDLTRTKPASISAADTYACMESIKNGYIVSTKYVPKTTLAPPAHVWVLANQPPQWDALSKDRWSVYQINDARQLVRYSKSDYAKYCHKRKVDQEAADIRASKRARLAREEAAALVAAESSDEEDKEEPVQPVPAGIQPHRAPALDPAFVARAESMPDFVYEVYGLHGLLTRVQALVQYDRDQAAHAPYEAGFQAGLAHADH